MTIMPMTRGPANKRGLFGSYRRPAGLLPAARAGETAPGLDMAPPPPANWREVVGDLPTTTLTPAPPMRSTGRVPFAQMDVLESPYSTPGFGSESGVTGQFPPDGFSIPTSLLNRKRGIFGNLPADAPPMMNAAMSDKVGNGAPPDLALNKGKSGVNWREVAGIVGDMLLGVNGQAPIYAPARMKERQAIAESQRQLAAITLRSRLDAAKPDYFTAGNDRVRYDPATGQATTLYSAPEGFENYADALGYEPGSDDYLQAVQDYILRSSGPTATEFDLEQEEDRQGNRLELEGLRQGNRVGLEGVRQGNRMSLRGSPTYRQLHPAPAKPRTAKPAAEPVATNPATGERMVYRGGRWVKP